MTHRIARLPGTRGWTIGRRCRLVVGLVCLANVIGSAEAGQQSEPPHLGTIEIVTHEVFDRASGGGSFPYRIANSVHSGTREHVIQRELLFESGERFDAELIEQTERNLRALSFLREARVVAIPVDDDGDGRAERMNVRVETWDTWSLEPVIHIKQIEDHTVWKAGFSDRSLLGFGKELTVSRRRNLDRTLDRVLYHDPQLMGSRFVLTASLANLSDGDDQFLRLDRPYVSLADPWSLSVRGGAYSRRDPLFEAGTAADWLSHRGQFAEVEFGRAVRRRPTSALRLHVAYRSQMARVGNDLRDFGIAEVGFRSVEHRFTQLTHVNRFERTEDFNLGAQSYGTFGVSTAAFGGTGGRAFFTAAGHSRGFAFRDDHFVVVGAGVGARHQRGVWSNALAEVRLRYLRKHSTRHSLVGKAEFRRGHNLDGEVQLLLGAASGLRGYPVRQFAGTRALLLSAEERWFVVDDLLQLVSLGVAAFVDTGFAWHADEALDLGDLHTAVGAGLLVGSSRLSSSGSARFDVGYAVNRVTDVGRWLFFAGSDIEF